MLRLFLLLFLLNTTASVFTQNVTGSWYGKADVQAGGSHNNYLTELILKQKGNEVEGIFGYYFKDSYQSFFIRGTYSKDTREVQIRNLPMIHNQASSRNGIECPMHFLGTLMVSQVSSTLKGFFYTDDKYKYTCPELRVTFLMDKEEANPDSILRSTVAGKKLWQPQQEDVVITNAATNKAVTVSADVTTSSTAITLPKVDTIERRLLVEKFKTRTNTYSKDLEVEGDSVRLSFYDNGDVDGDSISVFLNQAPVLSRQELTARALNVYLALDSTHPVNEISMLAENLGKFPPNTALMVVSDGVHRYDVYLSSSLTQNASVRLRRKKVDPHLLKY